MQHQICSESRHNLKDRVLKLFPPETKTEDFKLATYNRMQLLVWRIKKSRIGSIGFPLGFEATTIEEEMRSIKQVEEHSSSRFALLTDHLVDVGLDWLACLH
eukprot:Platyproteum_vivax@DN8709_c0_g1_i1.p1